MFPTNDATVCLYDARKGLTLMYCEPHHCAKTYKTPLTIGQTEHIFDTVNVKTTTRFGF